MSGSRDWRVVGPKGALAWWRSDLDGSYVRSGLRCGRKRRAPARSQTHGCDPPLTLNCAQVVALGVAPRTPAPRGSSTPRSPSSASCSRTARQLVSFSLCARTLADIGASSALHIVGPASTGAPATSISSAGSTAHRLVSSDFRPATFCSMAVAAKTLRWFSSGMFIVAPRRICQSCEARHRLRRPPVHSNPCPSSKIAPSSGPAQARNPAILAPTARREERRGIDARRRRHRTAQPQGSEPVCTREGWRSSLPPFWKRRLGVGIPPTVASFVPSRRSLGTSF